MTVPISVVEKRELVEAILSDRLFKEKATRAPDILQFLFSRHCDDPLKPISGPEIARAVYTDWPGDPRMDSTVRMGVKRLRELLDKFFDRNGSTTSLRLTVVPREYLLTFSRIFDGASLVRWFWPYCFNRDLKNEFAVLPPQGHFRNDASRQLEDPFWVLTLFEPFASMLVSEGHQICPLPRQYWITPLDVTDLEKASVVLIGCFSLRDVRFHQYFDRDIVVFPDISSKPQLLRLYPQPAELEKPQEDTETVLLTRFMTGASPFRIQQLTLLQASTPDAALAVAQALCSENELRSIALLPEFSKTVATGSVPDFFQIVFTVSKNTSNAQVKEALMARPRLPHE